MSFYRVTYNNKGIYNELKKMVGKDVWLELLNKQEFTWLPKPPSYASNNRSYFTEKGYEYFRDKTLPIINKYLDKDLIKIKVYMEVNNIIYKDEYQVVVDE